MPDLTSLGWLGYVGMAITIAINYFPKVWKESRSEDKEVDRLTNAYIDERDSHRVTKQELKEANLRIYQQVADFAKMNADNATLIERMDHMVREQKRLSDQNEQLLATCNRQNEQIIELTERVEQLQSMLNKEAHT